MEGGKNLTQEERLANLQARIQLFDKEVEPICVKHGIVMGAQAFLRSDGSVGSKVVYYDREEYLEQIAKFKAVEEDNSAEEGPSSVAVED